MLNSKDFLISASAKKLKSTLCVLIHLNLYLKIVTYIFMPTITWIMNLENQAKIDLINVLLTSSSYMRCLREPATIPWSFLFEIFSISLMSLRMSENLVAPSASTINALSPLAMSMPIRTAPPFPLFRSYSTTFKSISLPLKLLNSRDT